MEREGGIEKENQVGRGERKKSFCLRTFGVRRPLGPPFPPPEKLDIYFGERRERERDSNDTKRKKKVAKKKVMEMIKICSEKEKEKFSSNA